METNDFENLIRSLAAVAASKRHDRADLSIRVRPNGSGAFQFGSNEPVEFEGPNTAAETLRRFIDAE